MTENRRYEAHYDALNDKRIAEAPLATDDAAGGRVRSSRARVSGDRSVSASRVGVGVLARPARRTDPAFAKGWNDRVVVIAWDRPGGAIDTVVWRKAVTHREA